MQTLVEVQGIVKKAALTSVRPHPGLQSLRFYEVNLSFSLANFSVYLPTQSAIRRRWWRFSAPSTKAVMSSVRPHPGQQSLRFYEINLLFSLANFSAYLPTQSAIRRHWSRFMAPSTKAAITSVRPHPGQQSLRFYEVNLLFSLANFSAYLPTQSAIHRHWSRFMAASTKAAITSVRPHPRQQSLWFYEVNLPFSLANFSAYLPTQSAIHRHWSRFMAASTKAAITSVRPHPRQQSLWFYEVNLPFSLANFSAYLPTQSAIHRHWSRLRAPSTKAAMTSVRPHPRTSVIVMLNSSNVWMRAENIC